MGVVVINNTAKLNPLNDKVKFFECQLLTVVFTFFIFFRCSHIVDSEFCCMFGQTTNTTIMNTENKIDSLFQAQCLIAEATQLIQHALDGTEQEFHADAYIVSHLNNWIDSNGYDMGIQQYIDELNQTPRS